MKDASIGILFYNDALLLVKRRDVPIWVLPGGGIDAGETQESAVIREMKEETGLDVTVVRKVGTFRPINRLASTANVFVCEAKDVPSVLSAQEESQEVAFFALNQLPETFFFLHKAWLDIALQNLPAPVERPMVELTYWACIKLLFKHPIYAARYILARLGIPLNG